MHSFEVIDDINESMDNKDDVYGQEEDEVSCYFSKKHQNLMLKKK